MSREWSRRAALAAAVAGLAAVPSALAAPPVISGSDDDAWNTRPSYVVTGDAAGVAWGWSVQGPGPTRSGVAGSSPFVVRPGGLRDGAYVLTVVQRNGQGASASLESAERRFVVDTVAPRPVELLGPTSAAQGEPVALSVAGGERDAVFTWSVVVPGRPSDEDDDDDDDDRPGDVLVQGPVDTPAPSIVITGLAPGGYEVLVTQRDRAGNVSPVAALPLLISPAAATAAPAVPVPAVAPSAAPPATRPNTTLRLPARNAARLRPGRAATVRTVRPLLRWSRGPARTTFYNVQLFRVRTAPAGVAAASAASLRKVRSVFPRAPRVRTGRLARGACYVWRVWPYRGGRYTPAPLGVSHFCVARAPAAR